MIRLVQEFDLPSGGVLNLNEPLAANHLVVFYDHGGQGFPEEVLGTNATVNETGDYLGSAIGGDWSVAYGSFKPNYAVLTETLTQLTWSGKVHGWIFENAYTVNGIFAGHYDGTPTIGSSDGGGLEGDPCRALTAAEAGQVTIRPTTDYAFCLLFLAGWCSAPPPEQTPLGCGKDISVFLQTSGTTGNNPPETYATQIDAWGDILQTDNKVYRVTNYGDPTFLHGDVDLGFFVSEPGNIKVHGDSMFFLVAPLDDPLDQTIIADNMIWETEGDGISVEGIAGTTVSRNNLSYIHGTAISLLNLTAPIVENNTVYLPDKYGIFLQGVPDAVVRNNVLNEVSQHNAGVYPYINIGSNSHRAQVIGNRLLATGPAANGIEYPQTGIVINAGVQETALVTNDLRGALYGSELWSEVCVDNGDFTTLINNLPGGEFSINAPEEYTGPPQPDPIYGVIEVNPTMGGAIIIPNDPNVGTVTLGNSVYDVNPNTYGSTLPADLPDRFDEEDFNNYYRFRNDTTEDAYWTLWLEVPVPEDVWTAWREDTPFWAQYPTTVWTSPSAYATIDIGCPDSEQAEWDAWIWFKNIRHRNSSEMLDFDCRANDFEQMKLKAAFSTAFAMWARQKIRTLSWVLRGVRNSSLWIKAVVYVGPGKALDVGRFRIPYIKGFVGYTTEYGGAPVPVTGGSNGGNTIVQQPSLTQEDVEDFAAAMLTGGIHSGITFTYNDTPGTISATVTSGGAHDHTSPGDGGVLTNDTHDGYSEYAALGADPATPATGKARFYAKTDAGVTSYYMLTDTGSVVKLGSGGATSLTPAHYDFQPEFPNAILVPAAVDNGTLSAYDDTVSRYNAYSWTTTQVSDQTIQIVLRWRLSPRFSAWTGPLKVISKVSSAATTASMEVVEFLDVTGANCITPAAKQNASWTEDSYTITGGTWTAGGIVTIRFKLHAANNEIAYLGPMQIAFNEE